MMITGSIVALVTPMRADGAVDHEALAKAVDRVIEAGSAAIVSVGTTGESATLDVDEHTEVIRRTIDVAAGRVPIIAGTGANSTTEAIHLTEAAKAAGADAALLVTPYYNKPPQEGLYQHFTAIADATELPVMLYDIPGRTATPIETETLVRLAEHERIVAVKDAKGDLGASSWVMARTNLAFYSGEDMLNLPLLSVGGVGVVSVASHLVTHDLRAMFDAYAAGEVGKARDIHRSLLPVYTGVFRTQGVITTKAALRQLGLPGGPVRLPLVDLTPEQLDVLRRDLAAGGIKL